MTKSELIAKLAARHPQLVAKDAELAVKMEDLSKNLNASSENMKDIIAKQMHL